MRIGLLIGAALALVGWTLTGFDVGAARLAGGTGGVVASSEDDPRVRRVWANGGSYANPSPDGRLITFVDWSTGDVAVRDLTTSTNRRITDKGAWTENGSWAEFPVFSPDGRRVAYAYGNDHAGDPYRYELRYVEIGDTTQHLLRSASPAGWIAPTDWSDRGMLITEYEENPTRARLMLLDPATGEARVLDETFRNRGPAPEAVLSPDGRYVAYWTGGLKVLDLDSGERREIEFSDHALLDWTADGGGLFVHGVHDGRAGIWALPVSNGRLAGEPRLVRDGIPFVMQGGGRAGEALYYNIPVDGARVHVAGVDVAGGRLLSAPTALTTAMDGDAQFPVWSPDGTQLAYVLRPLNDAGPTRLMVRRADGDEVRELADIAMPRLRALAWRPDGSEILALSRAGALRAVSVRDGSMRTVREDVGSSAALSPDGRTLVVRRMDDPAFSWTPGVFAVDLESGAERRLLDRAFETMSLSPDGRTLAFLDGDTHARTTRLAVVPVTGGTPKTVAEVEHPWHFEAGAYGMPWTPDGRFILAGRGEWERDGSHDLWAVPVDGGEARPLRVPHAGGANTFWSLSPDGRKLAYIAGERRIELWAIDQIEP